MARQAATRTQHLTTHKVKNNTTNSTKSKLSNDRINQKYKIDVTGTMIITMQPNSNISIAGL